MNNEKFTITVSSGMQIASIEQIDNTVVVLVEGIKAEPLIHIPKEGDFVRYYYEGKVGYFICGKTKIDRVYQKLNTSCIDTKGIVYNKLNFGGPFLCDCIFETITKDEFCKSLNDLGYEYNFDTNEIEPLKWQPKEGEEVYLASFHSELKFEVLPFVWDKFKTLTAFDRETQVECQQLCDKLNAALYEK